MRLFIGLCVSLVAGCAGGIGDLKVADGQAGCITTANVYGSASAVVTRADNVPKGTNQNSKTRITCGSAVMEIDQQTSQPQQQPPVPPGPPPAVTSESTSTNTTTTKTIQKPVGQ